MRLAGQYHRHLTEQSPFRGVRRARHATLSRALDAHQGDRTAQSARFDPSATFLSEMRSAGVDRKEVQRALATGERRRRWDGCLVVLDRFLGLELELDPSGTIGIGARRVR